MLVAGARPNFVKVAPLYRALREQGSEVFLVHTGQHYDPALSDIFFRELDIPAPDVHLGVGSGTHAGQTARIMEAFEPVVERIEPDVVVVVGDVNSTLACALVTAKLPPRLAHVEAGLRSGDWSMPEEVNRVVTDRVSDVLLAPSRDAVQNLLAEGCDPERVHLVGNVMVDSLLSRLDAARARRAAERFGLTPGGYVFATLHRPATVDDPEVLARVLDAFGRIADACPVLLAAHPRTAKRLGEIPVPRGVKVVDPVGYLDSIGLQDSAALVLTDSGGIQEETTVLGVPCLTLRENTERPVTVTHGTNRLVGTDPEVIETVALETLARSDGRRPSQIEGWDGRAAERCVSAIFRRVSSA